MSVALVSLEPEIRELEDRLGRELPLRGSDICTVELDDGLNVVLAISSSSDRYAMFAWLADVPADAESLFLKHALLINFELQREDLGSLTYSHHDEGILYVRYSNYRDPRERRLTEEFQTFVTHAREIQRALLEEDGGQHADMLSQHWMEI